MPQPISNGSVEGGSPNTKCVSCSTEHDWHNRPLPTFNGKSMIQGAIYINDTWQWLLQIQFTFIVEKNPQTEGFLRATSDTRVKACDDCILKSFVGQNA